MKQNKYDDPEFFERYRQLPRSRSGLDEALEWPALRAMLPELRDKRVLDLGCGFGWHCRYALEEGARRIVGVDISEKMLEEARQSTAGKGIEYVHSAIEDVDFDRCAFDVVISSLALHYVQNFDRVCRNVSRWLGSRGAFVFSVEHPIFTAS